MPPLPVIADVVRVAFDWHHSDLNADATNVMHFRKSGGTLIDLANKIAGNVDNTMWNLQDSHAKIVTLTLTPLDGGGSSYVYVTGSGADWTGFSSSHDVIPQGAAVVKLLTALRGRSYRGRVYLPWIAETFQTNGVLDATTVSNMTTRWATFNGDMATDSWDWVVASYLHQTAEDVLGVTVEGQLATQRRRQHR